MLKAIPLLGLILALALVLVVVVNTAIPVSAATAGPNNAGTGTSNSAVGAVAWTNPGNITTVNAPYATITLGKTGGGTDTSHYLQGTNYGFSIPLDATINGITVSVNRMDSSPNGCIDVGVYLLKAAGIVGSLFNRQRATSQMLHPFYVNDLIVSGRVKSQTLLDSR